MRDSDEAIALRVLEHVQRVGGVSEVCVRRSEIRLVLSDAVQPTSRQDRGRPGRARDPTAHTTVMAIPLDLLTQVCQHLDLRALVRIAATCKRFRHGGLETVQLPTESPVVTVLRTHAFPLPELTPRTRPVGCSESWVAYLARCARQRRCREAPTIAAGSERSLCVDAAGRLLACGMGAAVGHGDVTIDCPLFTPAAAMAGVRVRSVVTDHQHSLALGWDGRVYSWGDNCCGPLGHGDLLSRPSPALVEDLEAVRGIAVNCSSSLAVTQSGAVFSWGKSFQPAAENELRPITVEGFGEVLIRHLCGNDCTAFAIGEDGELFSWGEARGAEDEHVDEYGDLAASCGTAFAVDGKSVLLGHGDMQDQPSPKRVEVLRGVRVTSVAIGGFHALALAEDGLLYAWGENFQRAVLGNPHVGSERLPKPVEALRGVRVSSITAGYARSYAVADTGELWVWGSNNDFALLGCGEEDICAMPKPIQSLRGVKVDVVAAGSSHTLALADDGSVYAWGDEYAAGSGALGLGLPERDAGMPVRTPQRMPALRVVCRL
jgi:alpha-tubulin suppressor-like RCC1 family protein